MSLAYPLLLSGIALLAALGAQALGMDKGLFGPAVASFMRILVGDFLGLTAWFLPLSIILSAFYLLKKDRPEILTRLPVRIFFLFTLFFSLNLVLLNVGLQDTLYAGLLPLFVHALVLHYLGSQGHATITSFGLEMLLLGFSSLYFTAILLKKSPAETIQTLARLSVLFFQRVKRTTVEILHQARIFLEEKKILVPVAPRGETPAGAAEPLLRRLRPGEWPLATALISEVPIPDEEMILPGAPLNPEQEIKINRLEPEAVVGPEEISEESVVVTEPMLSGEVPADSSEVDFDLSLLSLSSSSSAPALVPETVPEVATEIVDLAGVKEKVEDKAKAPKMPSVLNLMSGEGAKSSHVRADVTVLEFSNNRVANKKQDDFIRDTARKLEATIRDFGVETKVAEVSTGPVITRYELAIESGVKISRIVNLSDNIALSLAAQAVRIVAPIPGKSYIGIEIPNETRQMVRLRDVVDTPVFMDSRHDLPIALGKSILGEAVIADLASTPHLLVAGATGSGKSVCVNSIICSLLFRLSPSEIRFLMIDPKMVELNIYNGIPHLLAPVITDAKKAARSLRWVIAEMSARYSLLEKYSVRSIKGYNDHIRGKMARREKVEGDVGTLPYIVVIIDEFADLMMIARKEVEDSVTRLAAMSRAVGIHLILATQRPSVDVITGIIKANFPSRIAFQVSSKIDSRTILDSSGADKLLGKGDMLFQLPSSAIPERIQGAFLSDDEVHRVVENLSSKGSPHYIDHFLIEEEEEELEESSEEGSTGRKDPLFDDALQIARERGRISTSFIQRRLSIGYNRAARIVEAMEALNLVGAADGVKPREVLVSNRPS